jgi:dolichol-phosphate mannosyltransferase
MAKTLVIIPTYNERDNLPAIAEAVMKLSARVDLLVVDDNSPDGTGRIADELAAKEPRIHVLHRMVKDGLGRAYLAGFRWALERDYEFVLEMDGDFSHNPNDIPHFLEAMDRDQADLALGSRYINGIRVINWPLRRLMLSMTAGKYVRVVTGMKISDPTGGFKCFRRCALQALDLEAVQWLQLSDRADPQALAPRVQGGRSADHLHRPLHWRLEDVAQDRVGGAVHGLAAVGAARVSALAAQGRLMDAGRLRGRKRSGRRNLLACCASNLC